MHCLSVYLSACLYCLYNRTPIYIYISISSKYVMAAVECARSRWFCGNIQPQFYVISSTQRHTEMEWNPFKEWINSSRLIWHFQRSFICYQTQQLQILPIVTQTNVAVWKWFFFRLIMEIAGFLMNRERERVSVFIEHESKQSAAMNAKLRIVLAWKDLTSVDRHTIFGVNNSVLWTLFLLQYFWNACSWKQTLYLLFFLWTIINQDHQRFSFPH